MIKKTKKKSINDPYKLALQKLETNIFGFCSLQNITHLGIKTKSTYHNCLACQLEEGNNKLIRFLRDTDTSIGDIEEREYYFTIFILLLYLQVEKLTTIFKFIGITVEFVEENWKVLGEIRKWANFIKHPKGFTHHPDFHFETEDIKPDKHTKIIGSEFVFKFYNHEDKEKLNQTIQQIGNKDNLIVLIPNPDRLIKDYIKVSRKFCDIVKRNPHFRDILKKHTTLIDEDLVEAPIQYVTNALLPKKITSK
jgi:hypothetical protein